VLNVESGTIERSKKEALNLYFRRLNQGIVLNSGDFRSLLKL